MPYKVEPPFSNSVSGHYEGLPRALDVLIALVGLTLAAPIIGLASLAIVLTSRGSPLYRQRRVGRYGRSFTLVKLRTMTCGLAGLGITVKGDARVTKIGRVLRKWKIDELPSLVNVLSGEMSLVGPRPEVPQYVDLANPLWRRILEVRPGLTDPTTIKLRDEEILLASVTGNYESYYRDTLQPRKMAGYATYIESRSWRGDLAILFKTLISIARPSVDRSDIVSQKLDAEEVPKG